MHTHLGLQQVCRVPGGDFSADALNANNTIAISSHPFSLKTPHCCTLSITSSSQASFAGTSCCRRDGQHGSWSGNLSGKSDRTEDMPLCVCAGKTGGVRVAEEPPCSFTRESQLDFEPLQPSLSFTLASNVSSQDDVSGAEVHSVSDNLDVITPEPLGVNLLASDGFALIEKSILSLQSCRQTKNLACARFVYLHICDSGVETHKFVENYIVPMFVECGSIHEAQIAFNKLSCSREHSWTSLISGYCDCGQTEHAFYVYRQMQQEEESPSIHTYVALLKAFTLLTDLQKGRDIHMEVVKEGFEKDNLVVSSLIGLYSKCGSLTEALEIFLELSIQDTTSWTALIQGYAEHGPYEKALVLFEKMKLEGVSPGMLTYICSLKACGNLGCVDKGCELHIELTMKGLDEDLFAGSTLIYMFSKCGYLAEAQGVFDKFSSRDVVSWNALIGGYADHGAGLEALGCFESMKGEGIYPDTTTYVSALKACSSISALSKGREIHIEIGLLAIERDLVVCNSLVAMYASCGSLLEAQNVLNQSSVQDVVAWTSLITGYADHGRAEEVLSLLETMQLEGISPDAVVFACSLKACSSSESVDKGQKIHMDLTKQGYEKELPVGKAVVHMYAKLGLALEAQKSCDSLSVRDVVIWTAQISCHVDHGHAVDALNCFMQMQLEGIAPNVVTFVCVLKACGISKSIEKGQEIYMETILGGCETDLLIGNSLIGMYLDCDLLGEAQKVFDNLQVKDNVSWNTLIAGLMEKGCAREALNVYERMQSEGYSPDAVTLVCVLKVCGSVGALGKGREIHTRIRESGFEKKFSVGNSLISMYANCGSLSEAQEVFDKLPVRDVVAWSTMIKAYGMNHEGEEAMQCFTDMLAEGVKPDAATFSCLLLSCSHASLISEGQAYFKAMRENFGIVPTIEHYSCIVDLLARSGHLYEAENFILMACPLSKVTWGCLLSGCKTYNEVELGSRCFEKLVEMNSEVASWYVNMADIFVIAGRWDAVKRVEELRKHIGSRKKPASATIEIKNTVHEFVVGNNESAEVSDMLRTLGSRIKQEGHLPNLESNLKSSTDMHKEAALCEHAEKMALAFGLLNTAPGVTLRVSKNLRMCNDCHSTSKILSKLESREIILRDDCCIHHFKDGLCSCGDNF